jgi:hypothetical protein
MEKQNALFPVALLLAIVVCISYGCNNKNDKKGGGRTTADSIHLVGTDFTGTVTTSVKFGSGTQCTGGGICQAGSGLLGGITANFIQTNGNIQMWYATNQGGPKPPTYTFTYPYDISADNQIFNVKLWPYAIGTGAVIPPNVPFTVTQDAANASDTITFPDSMIVFIKPQTIHMIFGGTTASGAYNPGALGIYSVSPSPICGGNPPTPGTQTVGVTVGLVPGNASKMYFSFNICDLTNSGQTAQVINFVTGSCASPGNAQANYNFAANFPMFLYSAFSFLPLPSYAYILAGTGSTSVLNLNGLSVTDTVTYGTIPSCQPGGGDYNKMKK